MYLGFRADSRCHQRARRVAAVARDQPDGEDGRTGSLCGWDSSTAFELAASINRR